MKLATALGVSFAVKSIDPKARRFAGLASTWEKDLGDDIIHMGAFSKTLSDWRSAKSKQIPLLDSHNRHSLDGLLGKMVDASETNDGLNAEFEMRDTPKAADALAAIQGGFVDGLSIGYEPINPKYGKSESGATIRHLHEVKLREISLVIFPMNEGARVDPSSVKSLLDAAKAGQLTDDQKAELLALLTAAPTSSTPDAPKGIAPDDPWRIDMESKFRGLKFRSLLL